MDKKNNQTGNNEENSIPETNIGSSDECRFIQLHNSDLQTMRFITRI